MAELEFLASDLRRELLDIADFGSGFLEGESIAILREAAGQFELLGSYNGRSKVTVEDARPVRSKPTNAYGGGRGHLVWAEVTWIWELARVNQTKFVRLAGKASSRIRLKRDRGGRVQEIAMWRMEIGDSRSPGCHFHAQIRGEVNNVPFPDWMPVPRFPTYLATPATAVEFALAELFQSEWAEATSVQRQSLQDWAAIHQRRFVSVLEWQQRRLQGKSYTGAPLTALKQWKPDDQLVEAIAGRG